MCFLGYSHLTKGYKLLRLDTHAILFSKYVKFLESIFPYHYNSNTKGQFHSTTTANSCDFLNWLQNNSYTLPSSERQDSSKIVNELSSDNLRNNTVNDFSPDMSTSTSSVP